MSTPKQWERLAEEALADAGEWKARAQVAEQRCASLWAGLMEAICILEVLDEKDVPTPRLSELRAILAAKVYGPQAVGTFRAEPVQSDDELLKEMAEALKRLEQIAKTTHQLGAQCGPHWITLACAVMEARAILAKYDRRAKP